MVAGGGVAEEETEGYVHVDLVVGIRHCSALKDNSERGGG